MRYEGQSFELEIEVPARDLAGSFHRAHKARYGYAAETNPIEIVTVRLRSSGLVEQRRERAVKLRARVYKPAEARTAYLEGKRVRLGLCDRKELRPGMKLRAPAIVKEYSGTTLIPAGCKVQVDGFGNLLIEV